MIEVARRHFLDATEGNDERTLLRHIGVEIAERQLLTVVKRLHGAHR